MFHAINLLYCIVFSELVGKKTRAIWKVYGGMLKYIINYALYLAHYVAHF